MSTIKIISWKEDFIASLDNFLMERQDNPAGQGPSFTNTGHDDRHAQEKTDFGETIVVFPHQRPKRHLQHRWTLHSGVRRLPTLFSYEEFIKELCYLMGKPPLPEASLVEQCALLFTLIQQRKKEGVLSRLGSDLGEFLPWGIRLANLLEEFLRQGSAPANLACLAGELDDYAAILLADLRILYQDYLDGLRQSQRTTFGLDSNYVLEHMEILKEKLRPGQVVIAGFSGLTPLQDHLFRFLWKTLGAEVLIYSDPNLGQGSIHFAAQNHQQWLQKWQARAELTTPEKTANKASYLTGTCKFYEGYDLHSQLHALKQEIASIQDTPKTQEARAAIILCNANSLLPVMHCLPDTEVNISLGYPLTQTRCYQFLKCIFNLQDQTMQAGKFYWRNLLHLLQNQFFRALQTDAGESISPILDQLSAQVSTKARFMDLRMLKPDQGTDSQRELFLQAKEHILRLLRANTLESFARGLSSLLDFQLSHLPKDNSYPYLLELETMGRLQERTVTQLRQNPIANHPLSWQAILSLFETLVLQERIPFAAEQITGLQVLGLLESRLLSFEQVIFVDITEDNLPGEPLPDPLLPDRLRSLAGLIDQKTQEEIMAYHFYSLLAGSKRAVFCYQTGIKPGIFQDKNTASRFVEQIIWDLERERHQLYADFPSELREGIAFPLSVSPSVKDHIAVTPSIEKGLQAFLELKGLTPSNLNTFLTCPKKFFFSALTSISPLPKIMEEGDPPQLGRLIHDILKKFFTKHLNKKISKEKLATQELLDMYSQAFNGAEWTKQLTLEHQLGLILIGKKRLRSFIEHMPETTVIALESPLEAALKTEDTTVRIRGRIDRIDLRGENIFILDYKTGRLPGVRADCWSNGTTWTTLDDEQATQEELVEFFNELKDVQMPFYMYLYQRTQNRYPADCLWVELSDTGKEKSFLNTSSQTTEDPHLVAMHFERLLTAVCKVMLASNSFIAHPGQHCQYCPYQPCCT